jgi:hypothetical protein
VSFSGKFSINLSRLEISRTLIQIPGKKQPLQLVIVPSHLMICSELIKMLERQQISLKACDTASHLACYSHVTNTVAVSLIEGFAKLEWSIYLNL